MKANKIMSMFILCVKKLIGGLINKKVIYVAFKLSYF